MVFLGLKFIVVTTAITNSARLLESMLDNHAWVLGSFYHCQWKHPACGPRHHVDTYRWLFGQFASTIWQQATCLHLLFRVLYWKQSLSRIDLIHKKMDWRWNIFHHSAIPTAKGVQRMLFFCPQYKINMMFYLLSVIYNKLYLWILRYQIPVGK